MTELEQQTLEHEAGHCCGALMQGLRVFEVSRVSPDPSRYLGYTRFPLDALIEDMDERRAKAVAIMLLCGPLASEQPVPEWPLSRTGSRDEQLLAAYAEWLKLDAKGYERLVEEAVDLSLTRKFQRLFTAITTWLKQAPRLDDGMLAIAMRLAWLPDGLRAR